MRRHLLATDANREAVTFRLAPMSRTIRILTICLLVLPTLLLLGTLLGHGGMLLPALLMSVIYTWVWLRFRPALFIVKPETVEVVWPLKRRRIPRRDILAVRLIDLPQLRQEVGKCMRVGAGGLWGGFGWLWTQRRGIVQMYVSRTDGFVWIERRGGRPWLITPEDPGEFAGALSQPSRGLRGG